MRLFPAALLLFGYLTAVTAVPVRSAPAAPAAPKAQVRLEMKITRTAGAAAAPVVLGSPVLTTFDGNTGSIQVSGSDLSYSVSISPSLEKENQAALLWNLHLAGTSLPGVNSVVLTGATRVHLNADETIAELSLRDPKTGVVSTYRLSGRTLSEAPNAAPSSAPGAAPAP